MPDSTFNLRSFSSTPKTTILVYVSTHISFYISQIFFIDQVSRFFSLFFSSEVNLPKFQEQIIPLHQQASAHMLPENAAILIRCKKMLVEPLQNRRRHVHYLPSLSSDLVYPSFGTSFHMILRIALVLQRRTTPYKNARCSELTN